MYEMHGEARFRSTTGKRIVLVTKKVLMLFILDV